MAEKTDQQAPLSKYDLQRLAVEDDTDTWHWSQVSVARSCLAILLFFSYVPLAGLLVTRYLTRTFPSPQIPFPEALFLGPFALLPYNGAAFLFAFCFSVFPILFCIATRATAVRRTCALLALMVWAISVAYSQGVFGRM